MMRSKGKPPRPNRPVGMMPRDEMKSYNFGDLAWKQQQLLNRFLRRGGFPPIAVDRLILVVLIIAVYKITVAIIRYWRLRPRPATREQMEVESLRRELGLEAKAVAALKLEVKERDAQLLQAKRLLETSLAETEEAKSSLETLRAELASAETRGDRATAAKAAKEKEGEEGLRSENAAARDVVEAGATSEKHEVFAETSPTDVGDFQFGECLGKGTSSTVVIAQHQGTNALYAAKLIDKSKMCRERIKTEISIQKSLRHKNIVKIFGAIDFDGKKFLFMEPVLGGNLKALRDEKPFPEWECATCVKELAEALLYCHARGIIHCDVKLENLIFSKSGELKLADFGWSSRSKRRFTRCGTLDYHSPEMIEGRGFDERADIWAAGIVLYELLVGAAPFFHEQEAETFARICSAELQWPADMNISDEAKDLVRRLLQKDPARRLPLQEVLTHPWVLEHCQEDVAEEKNHD